MSYNPDNPDIGITYEDVKRENGDGLEQIQDLIEFNSRIQHRRGNDQFSKGFRRLKVWLDLYHNPPVFIDKNGREYEVKSFKDISDPYTKAYVLAGLIVIFQVFGDGNHRTADNYFYTATGRNLTQQQMDLIDDVMNTKGNEFTQIMSNPYKIDEIVKILASKYPHLNTRPRNNGAGTRANIYGGKNTKRKTKHRKSNKRKTLKNKKSYKSRKSKTSWDPNIVSPVFFGYSLKK